MPSSEYWNNRAEETLLQNEKSVLEYEKDLKRAYEETRRRINTEINAFYNKYAKDNKIELSTAKRWLSNTELKTFKEQADFYLSEVKRLGLDPKYESYLKKLSDRARISRLQEIELNIRHNIEILSKQQEKELAVRLQGGYEHAFYTTLFGIQSAIGFGFSFTALGQQELEQAVKTKWLGSNFSDRVWTNKTALITQLNQLIPQEFVRGRGSNAIANDLADKLNVDYHKAVRLARTEMNHISNTATIESYKKSNVVKKYEYLATLDNRTSQICRELDGRIFEVDQAQTGINLPPMHPHCRSTTVPHFDNIESTPGRVASDPNGRTYTVDETITYKEWAKKYATKSYSDKLQD